MQGRCTAMLVSVIVPIYNVEKYLAECLDCICNQTHKELEIILVDDGSLDSSGAICDEYATRDSRIKVFHIANGGVSNARNTGLEAAAGEYIMFVDGDDVLLPYAIERGAMLAEKYEADIVYGLVQQFTEKVRIPTVKQNDNMVFEGEDITAIAGHMFDLRNQELFTDYGYVNRGPCSRLVKHSFGRDLRFSTKLVLGEDEIWNLELLTRNPKCVVNLDVWYGYRQVSESASHAYRPNGKEEYRNKMEAYLTFVDSYSAEGSCFNTAWESVLSLCNGYYLCEECKLSFAEAEQDLASYVKEYPYSKIFCWSWAKRAGFKALVKMVVIKLNLVLKFRWLKMVLRRIIKGR